MNDFTNSRSANAVKSSKRHLGQRAGCERGSNGNNGFVSQFGIVMLFSDFKCSVNLLVIVVLLVRSPLQVLCPIIRRIAIWKVTTYVTWRTWPMKSKQHKTMYVERFVFYSHSDVASRKSHAGSHSSPFGSDNHALFSGDEMVARPNAAVAASAVADASGNVAVLNRIALHCKPPKFVVPRSRTFTRRGSTLVLPNSSEISIVL